MLEHSTLHASKHSPIEHGDDNDENEDKKEEDEVEDEDDHEDRAASSELLYGELRDAF